MPIAENGKRADIVMNALGVCNRLNSAQLIEQELNFIADNIIEKAKTLPTTKEQIKFIFDFVNDVNPEQCKAMKAYFQSCDNTNKKKFVKDILNGNLHLHQPPFWGNVNFDRLSELYTKYDWIKPYKVYINGKEVEKPLIIASMYFLKLKHDSSSKYSVRNISYLNSKNIPSKNLSYKKKQAIASNTPIRLGEMEISNLLMTLNEHEVERVISMYASSESNRHNTVRTLLTAKDPTDIKRISTVKENHNREILNAYFKCMGVCLEN